MEFVLETRGMDPMLATLAEGLEFHGDVVETGDCGLDLIAEFPNGRRRVCMLSERCCGGGVGSGGGWRLLSSIEYLPGGGLYDDGGVVCRGRDGCRSGVLIFCCTG